MAASRSLDIFPVAAGLARMAHAKDGDTFDHGCRMKPVCGMLAVRLGIDAEDVEKVGVCAMLHDIGKSTLPDSILFKPGRLEAGEYRQVMEHTSSGHDLLRGLGHPWFDDAANAALSHHERFDGSGYPRGTAGLAIPLSARIIAVADVYDALRAERPYKRALSHEQAVTLILRGDDRTSPSHFDPDVLAAFEHGAPVIRQLYDGEAGAA
ncbi:HD domain-containing phosphohydrolase [Ferrovibrio sp.]|uniref:HD-GYP domain-containing protein n=1 Tax=Ferrovibrio sp. TaxID=1917215 RepID=UPI00261E6519|nr:HD domain-containing phosphohydrolase [Ferrovibrio sp.]